MTKITVDKALIEQAIEVLTDKCGGRCSMNAQHTPGRLAHKGSYIYAPGEGGFDVYNTDDDEANARRLVACWNACEGIPTEMLEREILKPEAK